MDKPQTTCDGLLQRLRDTDRPALSFCLDGQEQPAQAGDTVLTAILTRHKRLRDNEFGGSARAGFCLMGACQECLVWLENGQPIRSCATPVEAGMRLLTRPPADDRPALELPDEN